MLAAVVHLAEDGTELWRGETFESPRSVSVNPDDHSCWVADSGNPPSDWWFSQTTGTANSQVVHLAEDGTELWRGDAFSTPRSVCVNPGDDSCWVADTDNAQVVHLAAGHALSLTGSNGSVIVNGTTRALPWSGAFPAGATVALEATPDSGWLFSNWSGALTGATNPEAITMDANKTIAANFILHTLEVTASTPIPETVASSGSTDLSAAYSDSGGHGVSSWSWDDGGAGGSFSPSASEQNPTYTAPANTTDDNLIVTLTVNATCDGPESIGDSDSTSLTVEPVAHTFEVTANAPVPDTVPSGGSADLSASFSDSRSGHSVASCNWNDGGAGGTFIPSPDVCDATYVAPLNCSDDILVITLTVCATCDGPDPLADCDSTILIVEPVPHTFEVYASADPSTIQSEESTSLAASFSDSRCAHAVVSWAWDDAGAGGTFEPSPDVQNPTYTAPENTGDSDLMVTLTVTATCDGPGPLGDSDSTDLTVQPASSGQEATVLLEVHPNERGQGPSGGPRIGTGPWQPASFVSGPWYQWKVYEFEGGADLWIQVSAQCFGKAQTGQAENDRLLMSIDGITPPDVWGIQSGPSGTGFDYQWNGAADLGQRLTLEFQPTGLVAGRHEIKFKADATPVLWWVKVHDLGEAAPQ
jgi:hypothetical protein